ncbi:MAG: hypothetical protein ACLGSD_17350 [Acidobacteriota bacterium]
MLETAISLLAIADMRRHGYVEVPPSAVDPDVYLDLVRCGAAVGRSDYLWIDGWRVYSPRAVGAGLYRPYVPHSLHTRLASPGVRVPCLEEIEEIAQFELPSSYLNGLRDKSRMN